MTPLLRSGVAPVPVPVRVEAQDRAGGVWVAIALLDDWHPWLQQAACLLSHEERARVARKRRPQDRDALVLCYALHRRLLAPWAGVSAVEVDIGRDAEGRPQAPHGLSTSLSHTVDAVAFAVGMQGPLGVDIESTHLRGRLVELTGTICHPHEQAALAELAPASVPAQLLRLWVRKEAYLKALGIGLAREMSSFAAASDDLLPGLESADAPVRLHDIAATPTHACALAAPADARITRLRLMPSPVP